MYFTGAHTKIGSEVFSNCFRNLSQIHGCECVEKKKWFGNIIKKAFWMLNLLMFCVCVFQEGQVTVMPEPIKAVDRDTDLNYKVLYSIIQGESSTSIKYRQRGWHFTQQSLIPTNHLCLNFFRTFIEGKRCAAKSV